MVKQITNAVVSAVYRDLGDKERRQSNIIVTGLSTSDDDKAAVTQLLSDEFNVTPSVVKCRRLGKQTPSKVRPLLVVLSSPQEAGSFIRRAKLLRNSPNDHTRQHVFVNADITKAEALAAYQTRCERRARAAQNGSTGGRQRPLDPLPAAPVSGGPARNPTTTAGGTSTRPTAPPPGAGSL